MCGCSNVIKPTNHRLNPWQGPRYLTYVETASTEMTKMQEEVLAKHKAILGDDYPETLGSMDNLAWTYQRQGRSAEAAKMQEEVFPKRKVILGDDHPDTLTNVRNLVFTYRLAFSDIEQGKYTEAPDVRVANGNAVQAAAMNGQIAIVKFLLEEGAEVNAQGGPYGNALQAAAGRGHTATEELLWDKGAVRMSSSNLRLMYEKSGENTTHAFYEQREATYICTRKGLHKEAIKKLQKALELANAEYFDPNTTSYIHCLETVQVLNSLAFLHQVLGLFEEASFYYKSAWKINRDDHNLSLLSSFLSNDLQLPELLEALAGSIPLLFYGTNSSSHIPNFIRFPWSLPSLFVDREADVASRANLIALTEIAMSHEDPQIRADTVCEFLAEIWPAKGPALLDSLESVIRDLRGGSRVSSQYVYWKAQGRESDMELSIGDPTVPIILIATEERLIGDGSM